MEKVFVLKNKKCFRKENIVFELEVDGKTVEVTEKAITDDLNNAEKLIVLKNNEIAKLQDRVANDLELLQSIRQANKNVEPEFSK